jgi:thiamine-phosphate pyrophosphorylase
VVTDDEILSRPDFLQRATRVLESGGERIVFHLRGPRTRSRRLYEMGRDLAPRAREAGSILLVNDRVDLALALDLPGAHLGQRSLPSQAARELLGAGKIIGLSVHGPEEAEEGLAGPVDFLIVGTIYSSPSHPGKGGSGVGRIREIREKTNLPLMAIGGVTIDRIAEVLGAGASGVAVRGGVWIEGDPSASVRGYLRELERGSKP